jgi:acyl carrier protein
VPAPLSLPEFTRYLTDLLELGDRGVSPDRPIGEQVHVDSARMLELAIALEQECGIDLPDDVDLRRSTPAELYGGSRTLAGDRGGEVGGHA